MKNNHDNRFLAPLLKYKNKLAVFVLLIFLFFFATKFIAPTIQSISETKQAIAEDEIRLTKLGKKEDLLKTLDKNQLLIQQQKVDVAIPSTIDLPLVLATIQDVGSKTGIALNEFSIISNASIISILPIENAQSLSSFHFKASVTGSLDNMEQFAEKLESYSPMIHIESFDFASDRAIVVFSFYFEPNSLTEVASDNEVPPMTDELRKILDKVTALTPPVLGE